MIFTLKAEPRNTVKKSDLTTLRNSGMIPCVVYGAEMEATKLSVASNEFHKCYKKSFTELAFYELEAGGKKYHTVLKDKQVHPVSRNFLHLDFMVVGKDTVIELEIPLNMVGEPIGLKEGGFMDVIQRTVKVSGKASDIPEGLELDVSDMKVGDSKHIRDLKQGVWNYKDADDVTLVVIHAKAVATETPVAEAKPEDNPEE
ncbi:MAG: 50S ribosomal protein L25 [Candidatus Cloacimonetes bacterium]|jgi:large subunit ribosomal protein L25|nr:50S ribosomal protein L25 [Candidatus Cloacimonadota bacterium]MCB5268779.1 50S ribosomal protein L25 [Candidatus Cloacimonadota bacterium]MDD3577467.1 50S ribosomal protein L25 [Candidatus Cloacimonadota bacterium]HPF09085.1 50S ribosomal protein L25 [Candidatus Cloacimonadota bacterium]HRX75898.1 50S ribosomal protein L25 [Candidatus Cloacimonadota bacterium]